MSRFFGLSRSAAKVSLGCWLGVALAGCAVVQRDGGLNDRSISIASPIDLAPSSKDQGDVVTATGFGLAMSNGLTTLGWFDISTVALQPGCHVVLVGNTDEQLKKFAGLIGDAKGICSGNLL